MIYPGEKIGNLVVRMVRLEDVLVCEYGFGMTRISVQAEDPSDGFRKYDCTQIVNLKNVVNPNGVLEVVWGSIRK